MSQRRWLRRFTLGGIAFILLCFSYLFTLTAYGSSVEQKPMSKVSVSKAATPNCPIANVTQDPNAALTICSPEVNGVTAGAFGSHVIVSSSNFSEPITHWLLVTDNIYRTKSLFSQDIQQCINKNLAECFPLPKPTQTTKVSSTQTLYDWTWAAPDFPKELNKYRFYAIVGPITDDNIYYINAPYTLLSSQPPCITIADGNGKTTMCIANQTLQVAPGSSITLQGSNWLLGGGRNKSPTQTVIITAVCVSNPATKCNQSSYILASVQVDATGSFTQIVQLPADLTGNYTITATNQTVTKSNANGALTLGKPGDAVSISLAIPPPTPTPNPTPTHEPTPIATPNVHDSGSLSFDWIDGVGLILSVLSLLSLLLYVAFWLWWRFIHLRQ